MSVTLALPSALEEELHSVLELGVETAGVLLCGRATDGDEQVFTANRIAWVPEDRYIERSARSMSIEADGWVPALAEAAEEGWFPFFLHSHPGMDPKPSVRDDHVEELLAEPFRIRADVDDFGSLIIGGAPQSPTFTGRIVGQTGEFKPISRMRTVGPRINVRFSEDSDTENFNLDKFDRNIRAFGADGQIILGQLKVGVVGLGGTGSAVAEQLARLGVGHLVLVDNDEVSSTNLTRIHGSSGGDIDRPKVDVATEQIANLGFETIVKSVNESVTTLEGFEPLRTCDVVFGCTDDHASRSVLNSIPYWYLAPLLDMGIRISSQNGEISGIHGRVSYIVPGEGCLVCGRRVDLKLAREEMLNPQERKRLVEDGYAEGLDEPDPAVVAYTTLVAATAVAELLERLFGFGDPGLGNETVLRIHDRKNSNGSTAINSDHFCADLRLVGRADKRPRLNRIWI